MICQYCKAEKKNKNSLINHERCCKLNPNKQLTWLQSQHQSGIRLSFYDTKEYKDKQSKARIKNSSIYKTSEHREKLSKITKDRFAIEGSRDTHSSIMKETVLKYPESYSDNNVVGRSKHFTINNIRYNSTWEYIFHSYTNSLGINCQRNKIKPISYEYNNKKHLYFPDFLLLDYDIYVEIKGYETDKDRAKWLYCDKPLLILKQKEIDLIKNNNYNIFEEIKKIL